MNRHVRPDFPDPWQDPEFAPFRGLWGLRQDKAPRRSWTDQNAMHRGRFRLGTSIGGLMLLVLGVGLLFDPVVGPAILFVMTGIGLGLGVLAAAGVLGIMGTCLFAVGDRLAAWLRQASQWPDE